MADLARLYVLCARIQELEPLRVAFREYIGRTGLALVLDEEKVHTCRGEGGFFCAVHLLILEQHKCTGGV